MHATTRQFTIMISGSNVEKHDVSLHLKFQGNRINILEITAIFIYDKKKEKPTVFFSIFSPNLPPIQISNLKKKNIFRVLDLVISYRLHPTFEDHFSKKYFVKIFRGLTKKYLNFRKFLKKKVFFRVLDLGELSHFPSIAPYF